MGHGAPHPGERPGGVPLADRVVQWQAVHGRHQLPWQGTRDAYRIWLSEVMLQQTQVATVLAYYPRFLQRFPDVAALAAAPLDDVLALWSGLGYYSRARHLHRCAQAVVAEHGGVFPRSAAQLAKLPGIGRSTAAAIAVFSAGERAAILDGNVKRVLTRVLGFGRDLAESSSEKALWALAEDLLPEHDIERYTQGLMDLGATICLARRPLCGACPLQGACVALSEQASERYPVKSRRLVRGRRRHALLWLCWNDSLWLVQRPEKGVWASLWSLPEFAGLGMLRQWAADGPGQAEVLPAIQHTLTHFDWTLEPLRWTLPSRLPAAQRQHIEARLPAGRWVSVADALELGLPAPVRKLLSEPGKALGDS